MERETVKSGRGRKRKEAKGEDNIFKNKGFRVERNKSWKRGEKTGRKRRKRDK